ncbi:MAG: hypothetical protein AB1567_09820 [bacterium]
MIRRNFLKQEKGIALTVAAVVMVILFLIATAFFISVQSESSKTLADKAGVKAIDAANVGAERAIWCVQQKLDNDPNWQPAGTESTLFNTNYDYFEKLNSDKRNPENYVKECIQIGSTVPGTTYASIGGLGSQVYAVKLKRGPEEVALGDNYWSICSLGIDRTPGIFGGKWPSKMELRVAKVIIKLGLGIEFTSNLGMYSGGSQLNQSRINERLHISGGRVDPVLYMEGGWNDNGNYNNGGIAGDYEGCTLSTDQHGNGKGDGWDPNSQFKFQTLEGNSVPENAQSSGVIESTTYGKMNIPDLKLENLQSIADYYITSEARVDGDLRDLRNLDWKLVDENGNILPDNTAPKDYSGQLSLIPPYNRIISIWNEYKSELLTNEFKQWAPRGYDIYQDKTGDGYTIFYIPEGNTNIRIGYGRTPICIMYGGEGNLTRAIIASEGKGRNFYDEDAVKNNEGYVFVRGPNYNYMGSDRNLNENVGIDIRGGIWPFANNGEWIGRNTFSDFIWNSQTNDIDVGTIDNGEVVDRESNDILGSQTGTLSILSKHDVILTWTGGALEDIAPDWDPQSVMRGLMYSEEGKIRLQMDLLLRGSIMAGNGIEFVDQSDDDQVTIPLVQCGGDGYDFALCFENVTKLDDGTPAAIPTSILDTGGSGTMEVIAWENIRGRKQIQNTF